MPDQQAQARTDGSCDGHVDDKADPFRLDPNQGRDGRKRAKLQHGRAEDQAARHAT